MAAERTKENSLEFDSLDDAPPTLALIKQILFTPVRIASSPTALRTYARTALVLIAATLLYLIAIVAYIIFYNAYVPDINFFVPVHLQFDHLVHGTALDPAVYHPHAIADISSSMLARRSSRWLPGSRPHVRGAAAKDGTPPKPGRMISGLEYDIDVVVNMPRTPTNLAAGNFMLELSMLAPSASDAFTATPSGLGSSQASTDTRAAILAHSSRPATLTYTSPLLAHAAQVLTLPLYLLKLRSETETLRVPMLERVAFPRSAAGPSTVPDRVRLELRSRERLHVYAVTVEVRARFAGVRWLMARHRLLSFLFFTGLFWAGEMGLALFVWGAASLAFASSSSTKSSSKPRPPRAGLVAANGAAAGGASSSEEEHRGRTGAAVKHEEPDLSDTDRTFPTYARQPPLRYKSPTQVKQEDDAEEDAGAETKPMTTGGEGADDEDDYGDAEEVVWRGEFHDSGLGTGVESSAGGAAAAAARRRKGNK